jgi:predicted ATPase
MYLSKFRVLNYKSFRDSGNLEFKPGINIIVGTNNSGKTAFLEALSLKFQNHIIHKSIRTLPSPSDVITPYPCYQLSLIVKKDTIQPFIEKLLKSGNVILTALPHDKDTNRYSSLKEFYDNKNFQDIEITIRGRGSSDIVPFDDVPNFFSSSYDRPLESLLDQPQPNDLNKQYVGTFGINTQPNGSGSFRETVQYHIFEKYCNIIYKFNAERLSSGTSPNGMSWVLKSDASNLAEVLSNLQGNPDLFEQFNKYVSIVIPSIKWVSVLPDNNNTVQIKVWTLDKAIKRLDLAYPLSDCGTGVSQVLAILYVIITSQEPQIIIIDEPQSFLHPGASKKLIEILKIFPQHQYFIATHSAEIIATANPSTIVKLRYEESETQVLMMNAGDIREQRFLLAELGVSLSDVFGADNILWVEGSTEELCFPLVLSKLAPELLIGTKIVSIKNTGDLLGKKAHFAHVMFDLYNSISGGKNLYSPAIGFVFDKECLSESDIEDLKRRKPHGIKFIERRMYENYLLHPDAIAYVLNQGDNEHKLSLTGEEIREWLEVNKSNKDYFPKNSTQQDLSNPQWVDEHIDAAKLLEVLFGELSEARVEFKKAKHSIMLTEWLLENNPEHFAELAQFLQRIIDEGKAAMS